MRADRTNEPPQLVIFDCDGVLVDSEAISNGVLAEMLTAEGLPTTLAEARRDYQGLLLSDVLAGAQEKLGRELPDGWLARYELERERQFRERLNPIPGAAEAVRLIADAGVAVCVASQGKLSKTRLSLALTGLDGLFPETTRFSAYSVTRGKPWPDLFLHAARTMGAQPHECAVVEDTPSGVAAATSAGMRALGYAADSNPDALSQAGAELLYSLDDLPARLDLS